MSKWKAPCSSCGRELVVNRNSRPNPTCRDCRRATPAAARSAAGSSLTYAYGISDREFANRWAAQDGMCAICGKALPVGADIPSFHRPQIDHDHRCCPGDRVRCGGRCIRGIVHGHCNRGVAQLGDDPDVYLRAAAYMARHNQRLDLTPRERVLTTGRRRRIRKAEHPSLFET